MILLCRSKDVCIGMLIVLYVYDSLEVLNLCGFLCGDKVCVCCIKLKINSVDRKLL